jgi:hypothetical protein
VPDLRSSGLRMIDHDPAERGATFECMETGTLADVIDPSSDLRGPGVPFVACTTLWVRFDDDGRIAALRTAHR